VTVDMCGKEGDVAAEVCRRDDDATTDVNGTEGKVAAAAGMGKRVKWMKRFSCTNRCDCKRVWKRRQSDCKHARERGRCHCRSVRVTLRRGCRLTCMCGKMQGA
jgi:hypothetical protein